MSCMAPRTGAEATLRSGLCLGVRCHDAHPTLVLTLVVTVLVTCLQLLNALWVCKLPGTAPMLSVCKRWVRASKLPWTRSTPSRWTLETSAGNSLIPTQPAVPGSLLLFSPTRSRENRFLPCLDPHVQKQQRYADFWKL